jgi:hypothetical protein
MNALRLPERFSSFKAAAIFGFAIVASPSVFGTVIDGGFEDPKFTGIMTFLPSIPGWTTTEPVFELWNSGFLDVPSFQGTQFAELNAYTYGTYSQIVPAVTAGDQLGFHFAHRGREGDEIMRFTLTDLGANGVLGGGDDTVLLSKDYTDGLTWGYHDASAESPLVALGNPVELTFQSIFTVGGDGKGNFLDDVAFGSAADVAKDVPETGSTLELLLIGCSLIGLAQFRVARRN